MESSITPPRYGQSFQSVKLMFTHRELKQIGIKLFCGAWKNMNYQANAENKMFNYFLLQLDEKICT